MTDDELRSMSNQDLLREYTILDRTETTMIPTDHYFEAKEKIIEMRNILWEELLRRLEFYKGAVG